MERGAGWSALANIEDETRKQSYEDERTELENSRSVLDPVGKGDQKEIPHNTDQKTCKTNVCLMFTCKLLSLYQFKISV